MSHSRNQISLPPQTGLYSVKVKNKNCGDWRQFDTVRLEISVGQSYHEGAKLKAAVDWCQNRFQHVHVLVNDTLQRYNLIFEEALDEDSALLKSEAEGTSWLARNHEILKDIPGTQIHRWEKWRQSASFKTDILKAQLLYKDQPEFKRTIDKTIADHWRRKVSKSSCVFLQEQENLYRDLSQRYLIEETAIFAQIYRSIRGISVYPGSFMEIFDMFQDNHVLDAPEGLDQAHWMRIDFARNDNQPKPKIDFL